MRLTVYKGAEPREFFVWVNPNDDLVQHNMGLVGTFIAGTVEGLGGSPEYLQFVHNPKAKPSVFQPFHSNVIRNYTVEYKLEMARHSEFTQYPSRLWALYLLDSKDDAYAYRAAHPDHTRNRVLKRCVTVGRYSYSKHDAAWIDFLRLHPSLANGTWSECMRGYWSGARASDHGTFTASWGKPWKPQSVTEILFYGRVDFPNKNPNISDCSLTICERLCNFVDRWPHKLFLLCHRVGRRLPK
jgi:hypothetical protein